MQWFSCKGSCSGSNPVSDTVKVDPSFLAAEKENVQPLQDQLQDCKEDSEKLRAQEELLRQQQMREAEHHRAEQAEKRRLEEQAVRLRQEQVAAQHAARAEAAAKAAAAAAEAKAREEEEQRLEAERIEQRKVREAREAVEKEAQRREEERLARWKVNKWCRENGFADMHSKKKSILSGSKFPLHEAVAKNNEDIVGLLVQLGADKTLKNSKGQTPMDLAIQIRESRQIPMDGIVAILH